MATEEQLAQALIKADQAGDTASAQIFANDIKALRAQANPPVKVSPIPSPLDGSNRGSAPPPDKPPVRDPNYPTGLQVAGNVAKAGMYGLMQSGNALGQLFTEPFTMIAGVKNPYTESAKHIQQQLNQIPADQRMVGEMAGMAVPYAGLAKAVAPAMRTAQAAGGIVTRAAQGGLIGSALTPATDESKTLGQEKGEQFLMNTALAGGADAAGSAWEYIAPKLAKFTKDVLGLKAQEQADALKRRLIGADKPGVIPQAQQVVEGQYQGEAGKLAADAARKDAALEQLRQQQKVAASRAQNAPAPQGAAALLPVKEQVHTKLAAQKSAAEGTVKQLTAEQQSAAKAAEQAASGKQAAEQAAQTLDAELTAQPGMDKETFGGKLRDVLTGIKQKYSTVRKKAADYKGVFTRAGDARNIQTSDLINQINNDFATAQDPMQRRFLKLAKSVLLPKTKGAKDATMFLADGSPAPTVSTAKEPPQSLSLKAAHSAKGFFDRMVSGHQEGKLLVDQEIAELAQKYKSGLMNIADATHPEYAAARQRYAQASRPLDIVEHNSGATVAKTLEINSLSRDHKLAESQVVGHVMAKANASHPVFTRMLQDNPELKDSARLYLVQDLFGRGPVTDRGLATWLKNNGGSLKQLGLTEEFTNIRAAKKAASDAIEYANSGAKSATDTLTGVTSGLRSAEQEVSHLGSLGSAQTKRINQAASELPDTESIIRDKVSRAEKAQLDIASEKTSIQEQLTGAEAKKNDQLRQLELLSNSMSVVSNPSQVASKVASITDQLANSGHITPDQHLELQKAAAKLMGDENDRKTARRIIIGVLAASGLTYMGRETVRTGLDVVKGMVQ